MIQTSCSIPSAIYEKLAAMAVAQDRSISYLLAKAAREMVERAEAGDGKKAKR